ncbi:MAG: Fe-S cluster assembly protein SufD [Holophagales bacterium]|nr:Fe-S cluster assembly protein SufD [Holophagales bacterium]
MAEIARAALHQTALSLPCPAFCGALRKRAEEEIHTKPLPTSDQEDWKYLDLSDVYSKTYGQASCGPSSYPATECLSPETARSRLHFVNGRLNSGLSDTTALPNNIHFSSLAQAAPGIIEHLGKLAWPDSIDTFANINTARFSDGALVYISSGHSLETPLHVVFHSDGAERGECPIMLPRILVVLEQGAKAYLVEEYSGSGKYLTSSVVEIILGEGASLRHDRIQRESCDAFHFCTLRANVAKSSAYSSTLISLGAAISRHNPQFTLKGEMSELELTGLSIINAAQTADMHSLIDHAAPNCVSGQLQKYIIGGSAHGIFNGQILVRQGAQQTNANQSSRNLLLSERARIDAKPQLEILADDVKCGHGATIGQLNQDELFYLQSRGLDMNSARNLLLAGFSAEVINRVALPSLRQALLQ